VYSVHTWTMSDIPAPAWVMENWPGRATMLAVCCKGILEGKPVDDTRYFVSSLRTGAEALLQPIHLLQFHRGPRSPVTPGPHLWLDFDRSGLEKSTSRTELLNCTNSIPAAGCRSWMRLVVLTAISSPWSIRSTPRLRTARWPGDRFQAEEHRRIL
jgi:hypothetical protein